MPLIRRILRQDGLDAGGCCRPGFLVTEKKQCSPLARELTQDADSSSTSTRSSRRSPGDPGLAISPDAFSFIFYTSGSTGQPKGVVDNHRNVLHSYQEPHQPVRFLPRNDLPHADDLVLLRRLHERDLQRLLNGRRALFRWISKQVGVAGFSDWLIREGITVLIGAMAAANGSAP